MANGIIQALDQTPASSTTLERDDFELTSGVSGRRVVIADYQAETPLMFRQAAMRLAFVTVQEYQTDGSGNAQTFSLAHDIVESPNTGNFVLYSDGSRVSPDSVDFDADQFEYTDGGAQERLHAYYVARDPVQIQIERQAPRSQGKVSDVVYDDVTSLLHERNQNSEPPSIGGDHPLDFVVPRKWNVQVYAKGPVEFAWTDDDEANPQGTRAPNAVLNIPVQKYTRDIPDLAQSVKQRIINPGE